MNWNKVITQAEINGIILVCLLVAGFIQGFTLPVVIGILGLLVIHYRADFLPARQVNQVHAWPQEIEFNRLKDKVNNLTAMVAFKSGLIQKKPGEGVTV